MGLVRVTAIASLTPLEQLDDDPFLVDSRSQHAMCARWAAEHGYVVARELLVRGLRPDHDALWDGVRPGHDLFVAPSRRVLESALSSVDAFTAECAPRRPRRDRRPCRTGVRRPDEGVRAPAAVHADGRVRRPLTGVPRPRRGCEPDPGGQTDVPERCGRVGEARADGRAGT